MGDIATKLVAKTVDTEKEPEKIEDAGKHIMFDAIINGTIYMLGAWVSFQSEQNQRVCGWLEDIYWRDPTCRETGMPEAEPDPISYEFVIKHKIAGGGWKWGRFVGSEIETKKVQCEFQKKYGCTDLNHRRFLLETLSLYREGKFQEDVDVEAFARGLRASCSRYTEFGWKVEQNSKTYSKRNDGALSADYLMRPEPSDGMIRTFEAHQEGRTFLLGMPVAMSYLNEDAEVWAKGIIVMILKGSKGVDEGPYYAVVAHPKDESNFGFETVSLDKLRTHGEYENWGVRGDVPTVDKGTLDAYNAVVKMVKKEQIPVHTTAFTNHVLEHRYYVFESTYVKEKNGCVSIVKKQSTPPGSVFVSPIPE